MSSQFYYNGYILTMEKPLYAEALFVRDGKIVKAGPEPLLRPLCTADTEKVDLQGHALLPSFIDPHSHLAGAASSLLQVSLDGAATFDELEERIKRFLSSNQIAPGEWVQAKGYDHNALREKKHPPRILLDHIAPENPLVLHHQSGHAGVLNSLALERLGIDETTIPPSGGTIGKENGRLTGYLEENAFIGPIQRIPMPSIETLLSAVKSAQQEYARYGITTVQEGMLTESLVGLYQAFLQKEAFFLDVVGYVDGAASESLLKKLSGTAEHSQKHFKIGGCKVFLDGSPQARTAWMETPYVGAEDGYCGYPALSDEVLQERIRFAFQNRLQLLAHCNGDAAAAQFLSAYRKIYTETSNPPDLRPVMIHAQLLRPDQMTALRELRIIPSFFIAHIFHWGDIHIQNFGPARAAKISPASSALQAGLPFTFHQDTPVIPPNMLETVWCAVNRLTKSGILLGEEERIPVLEALKAVTVHAAYQYFEEDRKGSLREGKLADLVILDQDPLRAESNALREIRVLETIKNGRTIYRR